MKVSISGGRPDIEQFINVLIGDIELDDFPPPELLAAGLKHANSLFDGDKREACRWMLRHSSALDGLSPLQLLNKEGGLKKLSEYVVQIEQGIAL